MPKQTNAPHCGSCGGPLVADHAAGFLYCKACQKFDFKRPVPKPRTAAPAVTSITQTDDVAVPAKVLPHASASASRPKRQQTHRHAPPSALRPVPRRAQPLFVAAGVICLLILLLVLSVAGPLMSVSPLGAPQPSDEEPVAPNEGPVVIYPPSPDDIDGDGVPNELEEQLGTNPTDGSDARRGLLVYDGTGRNYRMAALAGGHTDVGYVITRLEQERPYVEQVTLGAELQSRLGERVVLHGDLTLQHPAGAALPVLGEILPTSVATTSVGSRDFTNLVVDITALGLVVGNHSIGVSRTPAEHLSYVALDRTTALWTNVTIHGVVVPRAFLSKLPQLDFVFESDEAQFNRTFVRTLAVLKVGYLLGARFVLASTVHLLDTQPVSGDVLAHGRSSEIDLQAVKDRIPTKTLDRLVDLVGAVRLQLVLLFEQDSRIDQLTFWAILAPEELRNESLWGRVTLPVVPLHGSRANEELGISTSVGALNLTIKLGLTQLEDRTNDIVDREVLQLWDELRTNAAGHTVLRGVHLSSYAYLFQTAELAALLKETFGTGAEQAISVGGGPNPTVALLWDQNFTQVLDRKDVHLTDAMAVAIIGDYAVPNSGVAFLSITGTLWDSGALLRHHDASLPLVVADLVVEDAPLIIDTSLEEIATNPPEGIANGTITHVHLSGYATGTTAKTVALAAHLIDPTGVTLLVTASPMDVGVYSLSARGDDGKVYHAAMVNLSVLHGPTYISTSVEVWGYWVNNGVARDRIASALGIAAADGGDDWVDRLLQTVLSSPTDSQVDGWLMAERVVVHHVDTIEILELSVPNASLVNPTRITIEGRLHNLGSLQVQPQVRATIFTPDGRTLEASGLLLQDNQWLPLPKAALGFDATARFRVDVSIDDAVNGTYEVVLDIVQLPTSTDPSLLPLVLGSRTTTFGVFDIDVEFGPPVLQLDPFLPNEVVYATFAVVTSEGIAKVTVDVWGPAELWWQTRVATLRADGSYEVPLGPYLVAGTVSVRYAVTLTNGVTLQGPVFTLQVG